jgi:DNA-binding MurR/RpiR family transcriptional regulator
MFIVKSYALNNGKKYQTQKVGYKDFETFRNDFEKKMNEVEKGYNAQLERLGLGKVVRNVIETTNKIITTFSNKNIADTSYVCEW